MQGSRAAETSSLPWFTRNTEQARGLHEHWFLRWLQSRSLKAKQGSELKGQYIRP